MKTSCTYILFAILFSVVACREKDIVEVGGTGVLKGNVTCYASPSVGSNIGGVVKITVEGTDPLRVLETDATGNFQIDDLPMGTYNLVFERAGYGTNRIQGFSFVGGDEPLVWSLALFKLPTVAITNFQLEAINNFGNVWLNGGVSFDAPTDGSALSGYLRYYFSDTPDVSPTRYRLTTTGSYYTNSGYMYVNLSVNTTLFPHGTTVYVVAYPCADTYQNYTDLATGMKIYTTVAPKGSAIIQKLVP